MTRQRLWQLEQRRLGLCKQCGNKRARYLTAGGVFKESSMCRSCMGKYAAMRRKANGCQRAYTPKRFV